MKTKEEYVDNEIAWYIRNKTIRKLAPWFVIPGWLISIVILLVMGENTDVQDFFFWLFVIAAAIIILMYIIDLRIPAAASIALEKQKTSKKISELQSEMEKIKDEILAPHEEISILERSAYREILGDELSKINKKLTKKQAYLQMIGG